MIISHRGNLKGITTLENQPSYIKMAIDAGFLTEIDVWNMDGEFYLGHDEPEYLIEHSFFNKSMLLHCKNIPAVDKLYGSLLHWFWHQNDTLTISSEGTVICLTGITPIRNSISIHLDKPTEETVQLFKKIGVHGICTDHPLEWKKIYNDQ